MVVRQFLCIYGLRVDFNSEKLKEVRTIGRTM